MARGGDTRFKPGQSGNPKGRPKREVEEKYLARLHSRVSLTDWDAIIARAVADAQTGDTAARKWLSDYILGTPVQRTEITGEEGGALRVVIEYADDSNSTS